MFNVTHKTMLACGMWKVWLKKPFLKFRKNKEIFGIIGEEWEIWQSYVMEENEIMKYSSDDPRGGFYDMSSVSDSHVLVPTLCVVTRHILAHKQVYVLETVHTADTEHNGWVVSTLAPCSGGPSFVS